MGLNLCLMKELIWGYMLSVMKYPIMAGLIVVTILRLFDDCVIFMELNISNLRGWHW